MRSILRICGEACLTAGTVVLLFVAYLLWGTGWHAADAQSQFAAELNNQWRHAHVGPVGRPLLRTAGSPLVVPSDPIHLVPWQPFAFIRIPSFGAQWRFSIIEGT